LYCCNLTIVEFELFNVISDPTEYLEHVIVSVNIHLFYIDCECHLQNQPDEGQEYSSSQISTGWDGTTQREWGRRQLWCLKLIVAEWSPSKFYRSDIYLSLTIIPFGSCSLLISHKTWFSVNLTLPSHFH
jgi:hypothetical protein